MAVRGARYLERVTATDLLGIAEAERVAALGGLDARTRSDLGQFFTPSSAAQLITSLPRMPSRGPLRVLDPGAGSGVLTAALVARVLVEQAELRIEIIAVERGPAALPHLRATLAECERAGEGRVMAQAVEADAFLGHTPKPRAERGNSD